jgi:hypothetical protein
MRGSKLVLLLFFTACDPGDVVLIRPDTGGPSARPFSIRAIIDTPSTAIAESLGWSDGVPAAQIRVHRMEDPYDGDYWTSALTDSTGIATFVDLLGGLYEVEVTRWLTDVEMARATSGIRLLAGGRRLNLPTGDTQTVTMAQDRRGSLVFSEFGLSIPLPWETGGTSYHEAKYFEVYNNADTTVYLDGKYWGMGWDFNYDYTYWPCAQTGAVRNDPDGIWTNHVFRFPGRGTDYPLAPGEAALVAKAAVDHRAVHPRLYDLRDAAFEWGGTADNPDVPNLEYVGLEWMPWFWPFSYEMPEFLSEPADLQALPRYVDPHSGKVWVRIPAALVLDAWVNPLDWTTEGVDLGLHPCLEEMHRSFERLAGPAEANSDFDNGLSIQRRVLTILPDGRKVLQDANTSMVDFVKAPRTPGWIP